MFSVFFALSLASLWSVVFSGNVVNIERQVIYNTNGNWTHQPDTFELPSSLCSANGSASGSAQCATLGGQYIDNCTCGCTIKRSTFGFYDNQWSCTANAKVRQYGECSLVLLRGKTENSTLITIPEIVRDNISYEISTNLQRCYIIPHISTYSRCDGTWKSLDNHFIFTRTFFMKENHLFLKKTSISSEMKGRVLRLPIGCYNASHAIIRNCLLLKMQGPITCSNFSLPTSIKPAITDSITAATILTNTSGADTHHIYPPTNKKDSEAGDSSTVTITTKMTSPNFVNKRKKGASEEENESITLISGTVAGVIGLALIILAVVIILRRRNKRNDAVAKVVENVGYERGVDNSIKIIKHSERSQEQDHEYSYACVDSLPGNGRKMEDEHPNNQDPQISGLNHVYSKVEDLDQSALPTRVGACAYNTLEAPEYDKCDPSRREYPSDSRIYNTIDESSNSHIHNPSKMVNLDGPIYNVVKRPETPDGALEGRESPLYHVLEEPFPDGAPVLGKPESDEIPVHKSIGGQNPGVYGTSGRRDGYTKGDLKHNRRYNDTVYDSVGAIINDTGHDYEQLNNHNRQNLGVYQAVDHADIIMDMNGLTTHSNA